MKWDLYAKNFSEAAKINNYNDIYINNCLRYAHPLFNKGLPVIFDQSHLAYLTGYSEEYLLKVSNAQRLFYRKFSIPKKNGKKRIILEPLPNLKFVQKWILKNILYRCQVSEYAKAYIPNKSTKENARFHKGQKKLLTLDISNFFESINSKKVYFFFLKLGYSKAVAVLLTNLCCLNNKLPQGAVTSPALSNLIFYKLDLRISKFCRKYSIRYTRYADDMTFSGDFDSGMVIKFIKDILTEENFKLNDSKTRTRSNSQRQEVTGIVVNEKLQVPIELRKKIRQEVYYIKKYGLDSHLEYKDIKNANYIKHLLGMAYYIKHINPNDNKNNSYISYLKRFL